MCDAFTIFVFKLGRRARAHRKVRAVIYRVGFSQLGFGLYVFSFFFGICVNVFVTRLSCCATGGINNVNKWLQSNTYDMLCMICMNASGNKYLHTKVKRDRQEKKRLLDATTRVDSGWFCLNADEWRHQRYGWVSGIVWNVHCNVDGGWAWFCLTNITLLVKWVWWDGYIYALGMVYWLK